MSKQTDGSQTTRRRLDIWPVWDLWFPDIYVSRKKRYAVIALPFVAIFFDWMPRHA